MQSPGDNVILAGDPVPLASSPLRKGADVSWLDWVQPRDDQGPTSACVVFAWASISEILHAAGVIRCSRFGPAIPNAEAIRAWRKVRADKYGDPKGTGGLGVADGWGEAHRAGWFPKDWGAFRVRSLDLLPATPLLAVYKCPKNLFRTKNGCVDHDSGGESEGNHALVIAGHKAKVTGAIKIRAVYLENSWKGWGLSGMAMLTEYLQTDLCLELWAPRRLQAGEGGEHDVA